MAEFQAIILAGGRGIRLDPLTDETPKPLLPAGDRPLLWYQLQLLESAGFTDVLVVTVQELHPQLQDYVSREYDGKLHVDLVEVEDGTETAEALRQVADKIKRDFIVIAGDLITDVVVHNVADCHRIHDASVTMLLKPERRVKGEKPRRDKDMIDCIGLAGKEQRVVSIHQSFHMSEDEGLYVPKALTTRRTNLTLRSDLYDPHFYIFAHWVIDLIKEKERIESIKMDLIPYLINRQFRGPEALPEGIRAKAVSKQELATSLSLATPSAGATDAQDLVRCVAYILPPNAYCERADTIPAYNAMKDEVKSKLRIKSRSSSLSA